MLAVRLGERPVTVDVVATEGEVRVLSNMRKKADRAEKKMFELLVREMNNATKVTTTDKRTPEKWRRRHG